MGRLGARPMVLVQEPLDMRGGRWFRHANKLCRGSVAGVRSRWEARDSPGIGQDRWSNVGDDVLEGMPGRRALTESACACCWVCLYARGCGCRV